MDLTKLFQDQISKSKRYVALQDNGMPQIEATYKVFGHEVGDEMVKLYQSEMIIKTNNN